MGTIQQNQSGRGKSERVIVHVSWNRENVQQVIATATLCFFQMLIEVKHSPGRLPGWKKSKGPGTTFARCAIHARANAFNDITTKPCS